MWMGIGRAASRDKRLARCDGGLGGVLRDLGDLGGARVAYERALDILERSQLPSDHPHIRVVKNSLAALDHQT